MAKKTEAQKIAKIKKIVEDLISHLGIEAKIDVSLKDDLYQVQLEADESGILIGYHGETIRALQRITSMIIYRQTEEWLRIVVNVGDYRQRRQEVLKKMALSAAQKARFSKEAQVLPPMSSAERRIVHLTLAEETDVETVSEGEGRNRAVVVHPKL